MASAAALRLNPAAVQLQNYASSYQSKSDEELRL